MSKTYFYVKKFLFYLFIIIYVLLLAKILLFKYVSPLELFSGDRMFVRTLNLIPFRSMHEYLFTGFNVWIALMNVIGNIIIFIPLGLYLQVFLRNKKILNSVALTCAISVCVETVQYILGIGASDIDDVILNTVGGLLGVLIYRAVYLALKDESKVKTAIILFWCVTGFCLLLFFCYITFFTRLRIKIF